MDIIINILFAPFFKLINIFKTKEWLAIILIFIVNFVVKFAFIDFSDSPLNESIDLDAIHKSVLKSSTNQIGWKVFEPFYKIVLLFCSKISSNSAGLKILNVFLLSMAASLLFKFINKYVNFRTACWVSLFYFINSSINYSSQTIGSNALLLTLSFVSTFYFLELYYTPGIKNAISLGVVNCVLFYTCNAYIGLILAQLFIAIFLFRTNYKLFALSLGVVLTGCNYWLVRYFIKNKVFASQFNLGIGSENLELFFSANFGDYFFFNVLLAITVIVVLNVYVKKLNKQITNQNKAVFLYFFAAFILYFIFIFKSKFATYHLLENKSNLFLTLNLTVILGLIFGYTKFSSKINVLIFMLMLIVFLPSLKLISDKNLNSNVMLNGINRSQVTQMNK